nr:MAG TPA: hypothetical protein [Caudoviricetes sp.]
MSLIYISLPFPIIFYKAEPGHAACVVTKMYSLFAAFSS